ncbi:hypothetical protein L593_13340 [Salinarchaeum sp. Harcht-Bsk1]|uniref:DUF5786 family protein n=1 Tax=Salinarchaeum sp. Harcht-Bsk1 TaxID=1333523 RepID=UPI00034245A9|nr:DUF5786 family protein [Salinarchaeum sp. Harcht-Bsk1]AGN02607.1 hypothetical protein L593_13340 [Salinarchaeum sp. Harcht-Bsk1]
MGFGSYDESEQSDRDHDTDDDQAVSVHEHDHDGEVSFENDSPTSDLVDRLSEMGDDEE